MTRYLLITIAALMCVACTKKIYIPVETKTTIRETVRDTIVEVRLEREYVRQVVPDTISRVETSYAVSIAMWHGGMLEHSIENKQNNIPVPIQYVDREIEVEKPAPYPVEVEKLVDRPVRMPLRWYQMVLQWIGAVSLGVCLLWILMRK